MIEYVLSPSRLSTAQPGAHVARVLRSSTSNLDEVLEVMAQQGCTMFKADILAVLEAYHSAVEFLLRGGHSVNTPGIRYRTSIGGLFSGSDDAYDPARHEVRVHVLPGKRLLQALEHTPCAKLESNRPLPHPEHYTDIGSGQPDGPLTPGGVGQLSGFRLRFDPSDPEQGVFFIAPAGTATRVETMVKNRLRELIFVVPALPAGPYTLEVRAKPQDADDLRAGALEYTLTVA